MIFLMRMMTTSLSILRCMILHVFLVHKILNTYFNICYKQLLTFPSYSKRRQKKSFLLMVLFLDKPMILHVFFIHLESERIYNATQSFMIISFQYKKETRFDFYQLKCGTTSSSAIKFKYQPCATSALDQKLNTRHYVCANVISKTVIIIFLLTVITHKGVTYSRPKFTMSKSSELYFLR